MGLPLRRGQKTEERGQFFQASLLLRFKLYIDDCDEYISQ